MNIPKFIGCSGYSYDAWKYAFYPAELPKSRWMEHYTKHFNTVEINNTFYNLPSKKTITSWYDNTPDNFVFAVKGNRYITHMKKLKADNLFKERLDDFQQLALLLKEKLGCILWQFPGNLKKNKEKLTTFFSLLDKKIEHVIEFRHLSWFDEEIYQIMEKNGISYCMLSAPGDLPREFRITSGIAYVRFHGRKEWYKHNYTESELKEWEEGLNGLKIKALYAYFNNDYNAYAPHNARLFRKILEG